MDHLSQEGTGAGARFATQRRRTRQGGLMKEFALTVLLATTLAALAGCPGAMAGVAGGGAMLPVPIPDCHPGGIVSRLQVDACDIIEDIEVTLDIDHGWTGDLVVTLESPAGTTVTLVDRPGSDGTGYGCRFAGLSALLDDEAGPALEDQCTDDNGGTVPSISGTLRPLEPLAAFDGEPGAGTWTLRVSDWAEEHTGTLVHWQLAVACAAKDIDLAPQLRADTQAAGPGDKVLLTLRLANNGSESASGVEAAYDVPRGLQCRWAEPAALAENGTITQRFGSLGPGQIVEAHLWLAVEDKERGWRTVTVRTTAEETGTATGDDEASVSIRLVPDGIGTARAMR